MSHTTFYSVARRFCRGGVLSCLLALCLLGGTPEWKTTSAEAAEPEERFYNVVVTMYNAGQWQIALNKIAEREKLDISPAMRARYQYVRALAYERGGKGAEARIAYEQLGAKFPNAPEAAQAKTAVLYLDYNEGKFDAVVVAFPKIDIGRLPAADQKNLSLMYAESLYARKEDKAALAAYQTAIQRGADPAPLATKMFDLYSRLGMHAQLIAASAKGVPGLPVDGVALARAEALLALSRWPEVDAEAQKIPAASKYAPRAAFARAQALLRQNKLKEALAPLELAVNGLKDPPPPAAAYVALAECLLEAKRPADVPKVLASAEQALQSLPEAERKKLLGQAVLLRLRAASPGSDRKAIIKHITDSRATIPAEQLPKVLYLRLFSLSEEKDFAGVLATLKDDLPVFQTAEELGPSTLIYLTALQQTKRLAEGPALVDDLARRKPAAVELLKCRLLLASDAIARGDFAAARTWYDLVAAVPQVEQKLGKATLDELQFNRAVSAQKLNQPDQAATILNALVNTKPNAEIVRQSWLLLGQLAAGKKDYAGAAAAWKRALPGGKPADELDLRDRLGRVLYSAKDYAGAHEQFQAAALVTLPGQKPGPANLPREAREVWARSLFQLNKFVEAAALYQQLAEVFQDSPTYAYEGGVAFEKGGKPAEAEKLYARAAAGKAKLPAEYASAVEKNLAAIRFKTGAGDMGAAQWLAQLAKPQDEKASETAVTALRKVTAAGKLEASARGTLEGILKTLPPDQPRRYAVAGLLLESSHLAGDIEAAGQLATTLATQFAENEKKLDPKSLGATVGPAMIHFYRGELLRQQKNWGEALGEYETVLAAYPYNEWPDASACGAAECYLALGDKETALKKFQEVAQTNPPAGAGGDSASGRWRDLAKRRLQELAQTKGK